MRFTWRLENLVAFRPILETRKVFSRCAPLLRRLTCTSSCHRQGLLLHWSMSSAGCQHIVLPAHGPVLWSTCIVVLCPIKKFTWSSCGYPRK